METAGAEYILDPSVEVKVDPLCEAIRNGTVEQIEAALDGLTQAEYSRELLDRLTPFLQSVATLASDKRLKLLDPLLKSLQNIKENLTLQQILNAISLIPESSYIE